MTSGLAPGLPMPAGPHLAGAWLYQSHAPIPVHADYPESYGRCPIRPPLSAAALWASIMPMYCALLGYDLEEMEQLVPPGISAIPMPKPC